MIVINNRRPVASLEKAQAQTQHDQFNPRTKPQHDDDRMVQLGGKRQKILRVESILENNKLFRSVLKIVCL